MVQKIPPPPPIAARDPTLNRWLIELTAILNSSGLINTANVVGLPATITQGNTNAANITSINSQITTINAQIAAINAQITVINAQILTLQGQVAALQVRGELLFGTGAPAAGLGKVNDWYGDVAGAVGARIWIKTGVATWSPFPF